MISFLRRLIGFPLTEKVAEVDEGAFNAAVEAALAISKPGVALDFEIGTGVNEGPQSSLGGRPSLAPGQNWPKAKNGKEMIFICQINYAEMPRLPGYPESGLISFFVENDDVLGCDFPSVEQNGFCVFWERSPDDFERTSPSEEVTEYSPFSGVLARNGAPLRGYSKTLPPPINCLELQELRSELLSGWSEELIDRFDDEIVKAMDNTLYYGGYPNATQSDFREDSPELLLTQVMLQIGSQEEEDVNWGDVGAATFMLSKENLSARAMKKMVYDWNCH